MKVFTLMKMNIRRHQLAYPPYYFTIGITLSQDEEEVVKRAYESLPGICAQVYGKFDQRQTYRTYHNLIITRFD